MGKLSGDPLALLRNGENEMSAVNNSLAKYVQNTQMLNLDEQFGYLTYINQVAGLLANLSSSREAIFQQQQPNTLTSFLCRNFSLPGYTKSNPGIGWS